MLGRRAPVAGILVSRLYDGTFTALPGPSRIGRVLSW
jgi:hypothetical protein